MGIIHGVAEWKNSQLGEKIIESLTQESIGRPQFSHLCQNPP